MLGYDSDRILFSRCSCFVTLWLLYCPGRLPEPSLVDSLSSETLPNGHFRRPPSSGHMFFLYIIRQLQHPLNRGPLLENHGQSWKICITRPVFKRYVDHRRSGWSQRRSFSGSPTRQQLQYPNELRQFAMRFTDFSRIIAFIAGWWLIHWIGLRENLQETMVFNIKYRAFL